VQLSHLPYPIHRVAAEDGAKNPHIASFIDQKTHVRALGKTMGLGTAGCFLSHIKAWKEFLSSSYEWGLICEDDMRYSEPFPLILEHITQQKNPFWDICSFQSNHQGAPVNLNTYDFYRQVLYLFPVTGAGCYLITRLGAKKLLSKAFPLKIPVDHYFTRGWEFPLIFIGIEPRCVAQDPFISSEIDKGGRQAGCRLSLAQNMIRGLYVGATHLMFFVYNGVCYLYYQLQKNRFK
jgi:glycosyl transferase family 25